MHSSWQLGKCSFIHTWNWDFDLPSAVVASRVKLHIPAEGVGVDGEAVGDDLPSRGYSKTRLWLVVLPEEREGDPWRKAKTNDVTWRKSVICQIIMWTRSALTVGTTQSRVTDARVLVVSKVEKGAAVVSVQKDALVDHPFNNICGEETKQRRHFTWKLWELSASQEVSDFRAKSSKCSLLWSSTDQIIQKSPNSQQIINCSCSWWTWEFYGFLGVS